MNGPKEASKQLSLFRSWRAIKERPVLKARVRVMEAIDDGKDTATARWLLERKRPREYGAKSQIDIDVHVQHQMTEFEILKKLAKYIDPAMLERSDCTSDSTTPLIGHDGDESITLIS